MTRAPRLAQKAAQQADQAADQLLDWLRQQRGGVFEEMPDAVEPDAMPADQARVGVTATRLVESILDGEDYIKADPTGSVSVELDAFGRQDLEARSQDVLSLCRSTGTIEAVEALPRPGAGAIVGPPCLGNRGRRCRGEDESSAGAIRALRQSPRSLRRTIEMTRQGAPCACRTRIGCTTVLS